MFSRIFSFDDQLYFSRLSGDKNPIHVDPIVARRLIFGGPVVNGINLLLWALDFYFFNKERFLELRNLKASFRNPAMVNEKVECYYEGEKITIKRGNLIIAEIEASFSTSTKIIASPNLPVSIPKEKCRELTLEEASRESGRLELFFNKEMFSKMFPNLAHRLPEGQLAVLLAFSRLVGMHCPGMNSIFAGFKVEFYKGRSDDRDLLYQVRGTDERFNLLFLEIKNSYVDGEIKAYYRPNPEKQASLNTVASFVEADEFSGQRALIIGGSRGLGEVTAKLIAAGNGEVCLTYHHGKSDAERVVKEIRAGGYKAKTFKFDALKPPKNLFNYLWKNWFPTHLYYFATPFIFGKSEMMFSIERFNNFCNYYINGFYKTLQVVRSLSTQKIYVYYPSTVAIPRDIGGDIPPDMVEYAAAKAAGETLGLFLTKILPDISFYYPRLPRLKTDQTISVLNHSAQDSLCTILNTLRIFKTIA